MDGLSGILWKIGRYAESEQYHLQSIAMASSVLGPDAPMTLVDKNNYAVLLVDMGRYREAEAIHREVLAARIKLFGSRNSHTASSMCNLAIVLQHIGRLTEARQLLEQSLALRRALYPGGHPNISISLGYLSSYHLAFGATQQALVEATKALTVAQRFDGTAHSMSPTRRTPSARSILSSASSAKPGSGPREP